MPARTIIADSLDALEPFLDGWDSLATAAGRPLSAPGWLLPWWNNLRPRRAAMRVVFVADEDALLAVAPFFLERRAAGRRDLRMIGCEISHGLDVLVSAGRDDEVSVQLAGALQAESPSLVSFENVDADTAWPGLLRAAWLGRLKPEFVTTFVQPAPIVTLDGEHETWLQDRSRNFRQQIRQSQRRLASQGGQIGQATTPTEREAAIAAFIRLHGARWSHRGGTNLQLERTEAMLRDAARLLGPDRLRMWTAIADGEIVAVQVLLAAGREVTYWNGGWDERLAPARPGLVTLAAAIEDAFRRHDARVNLCGGAHPYKLRLADKGEPPGVATHVLVPIGLRYPLARVVLLRHTLRRRASRALTRLPEWQERQARALVRRARRARTRRR